MNLLALVEQAAQDWPTVSPDSDTNLHDVHHLARRIVAIAGIVIPQVVPDKQTGVAIVEIVDMNLIASALIRARPPEEIAHRAEGTADALSSRHLLPFDSTISLTVALFARHGCLNMAKTLRERYRDPKSRTGWACYTPELRRQGYDSVTVAWQTAEGAGNPWIRYGVTLARAFEVGRANPVVEDWVPSDSPYWS